MDVHGVSLFQAKQVDWYYCPRQDTKNTSSFIIMKEKFMRLLVWTFVCVLTGLSAHHALAATENVAPTTSAACPRVLQHTVLRLQDEKPQNLCQYAGQVIVVVNTASYCGFTSQYKGLEALSAQYKERGLVILGFPSNDFSQEPDSNAKIADFCENTFGVKFPMFAKTTVRGPDALPLYKQRSPAPRRNGTFTSTSSVVMVSTSRASAA
jgi:glutathione peroxidase